MNSRRSTGTMAEPPALVAERLFRVAPEVFRGLIERGLIPAGVALRDGLLVREGATGDLAERLHRMPLEAYHEAVGVGLLGPDDRVELWDGLLVNRMSRNPPHVLATYLTWQALARLAPADYHVKKEDPLSLPSGPSGHASEPEPDVSVIRGTPRDYVARHPRPSDAALVVEVCDSTLREDREKLIRYAWERVPMAWIVDLNARRVEVRSEPSGPSESPGYRNVTEHGADEAVAVVLDGREVGRVAVSDLLP